jgi:hypothetical protein
MKKNKRLLFIGVVSLLLIVIAFIIISKNETTDQVVQSPEIPSPWQPTTIPYDSKCEGECLKNLKPIADIETAHLRGVKIVMRPDINDATAQLGDCLDSIMNCVDESGDETQTASCVAQSQCPTVCKDAYAKQFDASMTARQQLEGLESIFLADGAICTPREAQASQ